MDTIKFERTQIHFFTDGFTAVVVVALRGLLHSKRFSFFLGGGVGKGENRHFSRATRSVSCARFAHTLAKIIEKKKQEEEGLEEKLGPRLRFPLQFNSSQGHLDCHLFQIWNMTRLSKMSRVLGNRTTLFDY